MGRRLMRIALALTPIALVANYVFHARSTVVFILAAAALAPLAFLIGEATENVAHHTGPAVGALVNASLGNAPELIIALFAVRDALPEVVRGSIAGSVVSTLLLVCGGAMLAGGDGPLHRRPLLLQLGTILVAVALFCIPAVGGFHGNPERHSLYVLTLPVAAVLLAAYFLVTAVNVRWGSDPDKPVPEEAWSLPAAAAVLAVATVATAAVSEMLVGTLASFGRALGLSQLFVSAVVVALAGNAAEQGGAIVIARRGNVALGADIAVSSATQIAVFVAPLVAAVSVLAGRALPLSFAPVELATMGGAALVLAPLAARGRSSRPLGVLLVACYGLAAVAFAVAGEQ